MKLLCRWARISGSWQANTLLEVDPQGRIRSIGVANSDQKALSTTARGNHPPDALAEPILRLDGAVLPGLVNVHSHAFQWGFAGLSEFRTAQHDSFWTWRRQMFEFLEQVGPDEMYRVAVDLYARMRNSGYVGVGEFHYLHRAPSLETYQPLGLLGDVLVQAALDTGLSICLLPTLYQRGGFDGSPLMGGQRRFFLSEADFLSVLEAALVRWGDHPRVNIGMALHSLRAVDLPTAARVVSHFRDRVPHGVVHIHVAEQMQEVQDCLAATGRRPVDLLLDQLPVDRQWCLIHATHLTPEEAERIARRGAVVGLCPTTEANLGDGLFPATEYLLKAQGRIALGGDSHVAIDPAAELRQLETSQRLARQCRAVLCTEHSSCGEFLFDAAAAGGAAATGFAGGEIAVGHRADLLVLEPESDRQLDPGRLLDHFVFCSPAAVQRRVLLGGKPVNSGLLSE